MQLQYSYLIIFKAFTLLVSWSSIKFVVVLYVAYNNNKLLEFTYRWCQCSFYRFSYSSFISSLPSRWKFCAGEYNWAYTKQGETWLFCHCWTSKLRQQILNITIILYITEWKIFAITNRSKSTKTMYKLSRNVEFSLEGKLFY